MVSIDIIIDKDRYIDTIYLCIDINIDILK